MLQSSGIEIGTAQSGHPGVQDATCSLICPVGTVVPVSQGGDEL